MADVLAAAVQLFECKDLLGIQDRKKDSKLIRLINSVSDYAERKLNRTLGERTAIVELHGTKRDSQADRIWLRRAPITGTTTLEVRSDGDRLFPASSVLVLNDDYTVDEELGYVELVGGSWIRGRKTTQVTYSAGYSIDAMPPAIKEGVIALVGFLHDRKADSALILGSRTVAGGTDGFEAELPEQWKDMLRVYSRKTFGAGF